MDLNIFGFKITRPKKDPPGGQGFITPTPEDGATTISAGGYYGTYVDLDATSKTESELITRYRQMAMYAECDMAIEDIVSEAIANIEDEPPVSIDLEELGLSPNIRKTIENEFSEILGLLDFNSKAHEIFRRWYVDGRLFYHKVIDLKNPQEGIQELRYIDALKMRYVRQQKKKETDKYRLANANSNNPMDFEFPEIEEYFVYSPKMTYPTGNPSSMGGSQGIKMTRDSVTYCTSGLVDRNKGSTLSYLHKAIKSLNQLRMIEDSLVIYRLSRAPERRIFYIDVGNLPKVKAEQYLRDVMMRYRNKLVYDASTGEIS